MISKHQCPKCQGSGSFTALSFRVGPLAFPCEFCRGEGTVAIEAIEQHERGQELKRKRQALQKGPREFAELIGILPSDLTKAENGTMEPQAAHLEALGVSPMATKKTLVEIEHDEGYGEGEELLQWINGKFGGSDMAARAIVEIEEPPLVNLNGGPWDGVEVSTRAFFFTMLDGSKNQPHTYERNTLEESFRYFGPRFPPVGGYGEIMIFAKKGQV